MVVSGHLCKRRWNQYVRNWGMLGYVCDLSGTVSQGKMALFVILVIVLCNLQSLHIFSIWNYYETFVANHFIEFSVFDFFKDSILWVYLFRWGETFLGIWWNWQSFYGLQIYRFWREIRRKWCHWLFSGEWNLEIILI